MDVADWLQTLGLAQYVPAFLDNDIDADLLPSLTADSLKELGVVSVGHRLRMLEAIAALRDPQANSASANARPESEPQAERRQVTVMFCDLVGSTALSAGLDPEDLREVIGRYHAAVAATVTRFDGFVAKYMGDGVLVYFGYPHAHEDDAEQAVRAGLELLDAVAALDAPERLQVRIGIATGLVVIGDLIGAGSAQEQAIVGETPNLAARLQALAESNSIIIAENTRKQVGARFEVADLGPQSLKGLPEPQRAWRVLAENRVLGQFEALRSGATPLVGRDEELDLLLRRWGQAKSGGGRVVLLSAEPGVGKSRLAESLAERIATDPHVRLRYFCSRHHQDSAFHPFIAQTERAAGFAREDTPEVKLGKLRAQLAPLPIEDVALIGDLHSLPQPGEAPPLDASPERRKEKTFGALLRQIERFAEQHPVLMVFEDIHWIDPSSRELLDRIIERIAAWPGLLVATLRPEFQPPWTGQPHVTTLALTRLDRHDTAAMVASIAAMSLPAEVVQEIARRTGGVPLFVEELTKAVLESGAPGAASLSAVPATLQASLMARLDRLGPTAKDVAQAGAAIGREFGHELLASIADLPELQLREALGRLTNSGLLFARGMAPQSTYTFKHALVQDAAYSTLLRGRRQQLHRRIAATLEGGRFPEVVTAQPALLAQHCTEAGLAEQAVVYWLQAGRQAIARSAMAEAVAQLRKGLDVVASLPDGTWRRQHELDLHIALRPALAATKGFSATDVGETITRARLLAEQLERPEYLVPLGLGQWGFHSIRSEHKLALALAEQVEKIGKARNDPAALLLGRRAHGITRCYLGDFLASRALLEQCHGLADPAYRTIGAGLSYDPYAAMLGHLAVTLAHLGHIDSARSRLNDALFEARQLGHAHTLALVLGYVTWLESTIGSPELQRHAQELLAVSTEHGFPLYAGFALAYRGQSLAAQGQAQEGVAQLIEGLAAIRATGSTTHTPAFLACLAGAHAMFGQPTEGLHCLIEAAQIIATTEERFAEAELHRVRADLLNATGDRAAAEQSYRQALAVAERQDAKLWQLRASLGLARFWQREGRIAEAAAQLAPVYARFTESFDAPDLQAARELLRELACA